MAAMVLNLANSDSEPVYLGCSHNNKTFWQFCPYDEAHEEFNRSGDNRYDHSAPTKQNILCDTKPAAQVIAKCSSGEKSDKFEDFLSGLSDEKKMMEDITSYVTVSPKFNFRPTTRSILSENAADSSGFTEVRLP